MNLIYLLTRGDKRLKLEGDFKATKTTLNGELWRSMMIGGDRPRLTLSQINRVRRLKAYPREIGWYVRLRPRQADDRSASMQGKMNVSFRNGSRSIGTQDIDIGTAPKPVSLPWPVDGRLIGPDTDLSLSLNLPAGTQAELFIHKVLDRSSILGFAKGVGVEIGPGPKAQVFEGPDTSVRYLEEMPIEKWKALYDTKGKYGSDRADFSKYIIGTADNIPAQKESLDFIFSSHVFEHLANPLGHLLRWRDLLKPGGVVLGVVPEMHSTMDVAARPSSVDELKSEMKEDIWRPTERHYARWLKMRGMNRSIDELMSENVSIHVHFYDRDSMALLLDAAVTEFGFSHYSITHTENHKDFYFCLWK